MAEIPEPTNTTIAAIWSAYEANQELGFREHLGASLIGRECKRSIWYSWRWATAVRHPGRILRLFQTGHRAEERFVADLRSAGVTVYEVDEQTGAQWTVRDESGHFGGSMDAVGVGFVEATKAWHVCEFKTHNAKSFTNLTTKGVREAKPEHWAQMQVYMHLGGLERAFYLAANKNDDDLYAERVRYDAAEALKLVAKAHSIIASEQPPARISKDPTWWECKFCDHAVVCHGNAVPEAHCRSCLYSTPVEGGAWQCDATKTLRDKGEQLTGCGGHLYIPGLIHGEQIDADTDAGWIDYRMPDGTTWRDGVPF